MFEVVNVCVFDWYGLVESVTVVALKPVTLTPGKATDVIPDWVSVGLSVIVKVPVAAGL